jgi:hypothetical protein
MEQFMKFLSNLSVVISIWFSAAAHPVQELIALSRLSSSEMIANRLARVGTVSYALALFTLAPLLHQFGIDIGNFGFVASNAIAVSLTYAITAVCVHTCLIARGQRSELLRTAAFFSMPNFTYFPLTALLGAPSTFKLYSVIFYAKQQHLSFINVVEYMRTELPKFNLETNAWIVTWLTYLSLLSLAVSTLSLALSSEALVQLYDNDRSQVYKAVTDGMLIGIVLALPTVGVFYCFVVYAFMGTP